MAACFEALGWTHDRTASSHLVYVDSKGKIAGIDTNWTPASGPMIKHVVEIQAGLTRDAFYCATKATAKKIGKRVR